MAAVCLKAIKMLHQAGELDDYLHASRLGTLLVGENGLAAHAALAARIVNEGGDVYTDVMWYACCFVWVYAAGHTNFRASKC